MSGRKTVLLVDDDPGTLHVLATGLSNVLGVYEVVTATNGREAIDTMEARHVDLLVTDLAMPVMDGFALIAHVTQRRSTLPVVVLSGMAPANMDQRLAGYGGLRVLRKPVTFQSLAACILEEFERVAAGKVEGIPLAGVLQLVESERRSCAVVVTSGKRRGRLHFESGRLVNAFSDDFGAEGEAAAYDILSWGETAIAFENLPHHLRKLIHTPMQLMLLELAVVQDQARALHASTDPSAPDGQDADAAATEPDDAAAAAIDDEPPIAAPAEGPGAPAPDGADDAAAAARVDVTHVEQVEGDTAATLLHGTGNGEVMGHDPPNGEPTTTTASAPEVETQAAADAEGGDDASAPLDDGHVRDMVAAVERLAARAREADEALAAVAAEVDAFRAAQRRFDEISARRELRRRELEEFREDVARLAREILGRVDGLFDAMAPDPMPSATDPEAAQRNPT
jgi:CheY-like chemotaxis protein